MIMKVSKGDLFGIFYVRKPDGIKWDSYYRTIDALRPLFKDEEFRTVISGFYLNVCGNSDSVRISYFVDKVNSERAVSVFKDFFSRKGILEIQNSSAPHEDVVAGSYGGAGYEERFRTFLVNETQIGLDLLEGDLLHARMLFAMYRWQVRQSSLHFEKHFEPAFKKYSPIYNSWSVEEKHQFFADLEEWPNPPQVDWAHMMVNFVLGCDWFPVECWMYSKPLTIPQVNAILGRDDMGFRIPLDWKP
jgi:hypothetical protein